VDEETVDDAVSALELLEARGQINGDQVYVLGHSLGAFLAPRIAVQAEEAGVEPDGLILLAPAARPLEDLIYDQSLYLAELDGEVSAEEQAQLDELEQQVGAVRQGDETAEASELPLGVPASYWRSLEGYDPLAVAGQLDQPILALFGERDYQVTEQDESAWRSAFADEGRVHIEQLANLNHLFMSGSGPSSPAEYEQADNVDLLVIQRVSAWIRAMR
ncbi:MAG TPA: alpha/beta fold hydrolase, partial [Thermoleophilia bacterium]|nr:alpha/beta fold hydrolase [Thermoleophilia bacterium]